MTVYRADRLDGEALIEGLARVGLFLSYFSAVKLHFSDGTHNEGRT